ncbi:MAG: bifunctional glutamate N-acetyltransferase/amino-acid acetyltransferase ArgJ [Candidatus Saganbacteria bacterium]|nr:bifunctional glutamate N-acetyltransferase/amino-acid acetyltransferase ArgJ [Candidatus Saganbacteria bacterium]
MKKVKGGVCAPRGFLASGIACGLKKSGKPDLALIYSEVPAAAVGVFTTNQVKAAPVYVSLKQLRKGKAQAIIANAGNANCWTGQKGMMDALTMVSKTAKALSIRESSVLVASTGVIAKPLPIAKIKKGIPRLVRSLSKSGSTKAAQAILTTDTRIKEVAIKVGSITIAGIAKGSGMIAPGMATMFAFITTDAQINKDLFQKLIRRAVAKSFNMVSVDNCMSTNDCVLALANGLSGVRVGRRGAEFAKGLEYVCEYLAKEIARDGEGAKKLMAVKVSGAKDEKDARAAASAIINSFLLKAAVYGRDKNVGRILQAVGTTSAKVDWDKFKFDWKIGSKEDVIAVKLGVGKAHALGWGCDLTEGYVRINAKYTT